MSVRAAAKDCQACDLYKDATRIVFGEGAPKASLMLIGEQPGDAEDIAGHPFVGPAGKLLDRALEEAQRGQSIASPLAPLVMATVHPSSLLRAPEETRRRETRRFNGDLRALARALSSVSR